VLSVWRAAVVAACGSPDWKALSVAR